MKLNSAAYKKAYKPAMAVFEVSNRFPAEARFALTGQIRWRLGK